MIEKAIEWWENLSHEDRFNYELYSGILGHDEGTCVDDILEIYKNVHSDMGMIKDSIVVCVKIGKALTIGKQYKILFRHPNSLRVINDDNDDFTYIVPHFMSLSNYRNDKINQIYDDTDTDTE